MRFAINKALQGSLRKLYWRQGQKVLLATQQPIIDLASDVEPDALKARVRLLMKPDKMSEYLTELWVRTGSIFAVDIIKRMERIPKKQETSIDFWEDHYRIYTRERSALIAGEILDTQAVVVNNIIDDLLKEGMERGIGIPEIQRQMRNDLAEGLTQINRYQAERIARTEVIGASNTGSFEGATEMGFETMKKAWLTSGLAGMRDSHMAYEQLGAVAMNYEYAPGLQYPGDPSGSPEEIVNCRCTQVYEVD